MLSTYLLVAKKADDRIEDSALITTKTYIRVVINVVRRKAM